MRADTEVRVRGLKFYDAFLSSRGLNGWSGPISDTLYLQYMDEETFTVSKVGGTPVTLRTDDQPLGVQYYLRRQVNGALQIDLHKLTALLDVPEWTRKILRRPRVWRWLHEQQEDARDVLEMASYARNPQSNGRAHIKLPYMKLLCAAPHLQILGVMVDD